MFDFSENPDFYHEFILFVRYFHCSLLREYNLNIVAKVSNSAFQELTGSKCCRKSTMDNFSLLLVDE
jgi:hypothetical protein